MDEIKPPASLDSPQMADPTLVPLEDGSVISADEVSQIIASPPLDETDPTFSTQEPVDLDSALAEYDKQQKFDAPLTAAALGAASGATFSISDRLLQKLGLFSAEELKNYADVNPGWDTAGQLAGMIGPALLTGGGSAAAEVGAKVAAKTTAKSLAKGAVKTIGAPVVGAELAAKAAEKASAKILGTAIAETGQKKLVQEVLKKSIAKSAGSAVEGAAFGANQLLREDALGKTPLNAENLLAYAGEGAAAGAALGALLVPGGALLKGFSTGLGKGAKKVGSVLFDAERDAAKLMGLSESKIARFQEKAPNFLKELPEWVSTKLELKPMDTAQTLLHKLGVVEEHAALSMDNAIFKLDEIAQQRGLKLSSRIYDSIAEEIEARFVTPYRGQSAMQSYSAKAREIVEDLRNKALRTNKATFADLRALRINMDKLAKSFYKSMDPSEAARAAFATRDLLKKTILSYGKAVDANVAAKFSDAAKDYYYAASLGSSLARKAGGPQDFLSFKDAILGTVGAAAGPAGLAAAAGRKFLVSDFKRKLSILAHVEKSNKAVKSKIAESIVSFMEKSKGGGRATRLASVGLLTKSALANNKDQSEPKNKQVAFQNIQQNLGTLIADPSAMQERVAKVTAPFQGAAPETAEHLGLAMARAASFLASKLPKGQDADVFGKSKFQPSSMQISQFERYLQAVEQPLSVLQDLEQGTLTREHVEALKAVYPQIYNEIRFAVLEAAQAPDTEFSYNRKVQLGILLDVPTDSTLDASFIASMQQTFDNIQGMGGEEVAEQTQNQTGLNQLDLANRDQSETEAMLNRRG